MVDSWQSLLESPVFSHPSVRSPKVGTHSLASLKKRLLNLKSRPSSYKCSIFKKSWMGELEDNSVKVPAAEEECDGHGGHSILDEFPKRHEEEIQKNIKKVGEKVIVSPTSSKNSALHGLISESRDPDGNESTDTVEAVDSWQSLLEFPVLSHPSDPPPKFQAHSLASLKKRVLHVKRRPSCNMCSIFEKSWTGPLETNSVKVPAAEEEWDGHAGHSILDEFPKRHEEEVQKNIKKMEEAAIVSPTSSRNSALRGLIAESRDPDGNESTATVEMVDSWQSLLKSPVFSHPSDPPPIVGTHSLASLKKRVFNLKSRPSSNKCSIFKKSWMGELEDNSVKVPAAEEEWDGHGGHSILDEFPK